MSPFDIAMRAVDDYATARVLAAIGTTTRDQVDLAQAAARAAILAHAEAHNQALHKLNLLPVRDDMAASLAREIKGMTA